MDRENQMKHLNDKDKEDLSILEEITGELNRRELYIFRMARDFKDIGYNQDD